MEKFEHEMFYTVNEGVKKLNEYVEKGLIISNLNVIPNVNVGFTFVYSVRQKFEKKENNRDRNNEKNFGDRKPMYKKENDGSRTERNIKPNMEKMLKDVLGSDGLDNTDYNNRRTEKNRRKNNYENKKKYK